MFRKRNSFCLYVYSMSDLNESGDCVVFYVLFLSIYLEFSGIYSVFLQGFLKIQWVDAPQCSTASQAQPFESGGCAEFRAVWENLAKRSATLYVKPFMSHVTPFP